MVLSRKTLMTSFFFLLLFFWLLAFGYFEGLLNADATTRQYGNYLIVNTMASCRSWQLTLHWHTQSPASHCRRFQPVRHARTAALS